MKKEYTILILIAIILAGGYFWWSLPIHLLKDVKTDDVKRIEVFNGNSGNHFVIENEKDIDYILSNIQSLSVKRQKISIGSMGTLYNLRFIDSKGKVIDEFIVNHYDTIRKDPFFYKESTSGLCVNYLRSLENE